jgi:hypothetical protein
MAGDGHVAGAGQWGPGCEDLQPAQGGEHVRDLPGVEPVSEHVNEPGSARTIEHLVEAGVSHVRVDQQHRPLNESGDCCVIGGDRRSAVQPLRTREHESLSYSVPGRVSIASLSARKAQRS